MRPVTDSFLNTVRGAHQAIFRARVLEPGWNGVDPGPHVNGAPSLEIPVISGDVVFDTRADVNATCEVFVDIDWPATAEAIASPYGQELFIERGVTYGNGVREWVGLGYFRIDSAVQDNAPDGLIRLSGSDRMANLRDFRPTSPIEFAAGSSVGAVIDLVVKDAFPSAITLYDFDAYGTLLTSTHVLSDDRIKFLRELITAYGRVFYWDYAGRFVVKRNPSETEITSAVFDINAGRNGVLVSMSRAISREGVYNAVVAEGEPVGEQPPVRGVVYDLDPTSPTYWDGRFGRVPRFFSSSFLQTEAQCIGAASSILASSRGIPYTVSLGVVPNPALEGWDVVTVNYDDQQPTEVHILDRLTYSLGVDGAMQLDTRNQNL